MKKILTLIVVSNFSFIFGDCPSSNYPPGFEGWGYGTYISGPSQLNEWEALYGDCESYSLKGLYVHVYHMTELEGVFSGLHTIEDNLQIVSWGSLTSINDFHNLTFIGGRLEMDDINSLSSIQGLGENGISVNSLLISDGLSLSNCSDIPLFNCNMSLRSTLAQIDGLGCDSIDIIGCDGECKPFNKSSGNSNTDLLLSDCAGNCGGSNYFSYCYEEMDPDDMVSDGSIVCEDNALTCGGSLYGGDVGEHCDCNVDLEYDNAYNAGVASVDITSDNQASYDAGVASVDLSNFTCNELSMQYDNVGCVDQNALTQADVDAAAAAAYAAAVASITPEDGINQATVDAAVAVAEMESYILGAQSGDINNSGFLNVTDIIMYVEKILVSDDY